MKFWARNSFRGFKMTLFVKESFISHAGLDLDFKIECDALTEDDWKTLAYIVSKHIKFKFAYGIPRGGLKLSVPLMEYQTDAANLPVLIVDDVLTTGGSMEKAREHLIKIFPKDHFVGVVAFARMEHADWIKPIFRLWGK